MSQRRAPTLPGRGGARRALRTSSAAPAAPSSDALGRYLQEIGRLPLLSPAEELDLARRVRGGAARRREILAAAPATARLALERWRELRRRGRSPNGLGTRPGNGGAAETQRLTRALRRVERAERQCAADAGPSESLRRAVLAADLGEPLYDEVHGLLRRLRAEGDAAARRDARRELRAVRRCTGLPLRRLRALVDAADAARRERDAAAQALAGRNLRLVVSAARRFQGLGVSLSDLVQEGNLGLLRAVARFEPERGHRFSTYALWWIRQSLVRAVQNHARTVRLPTHVNERLFRYGRVAGDLSARQGGEVSDEDVARQMGEERGTVERLRALRPGSVSLQAGAQDDGRPLQDALADPRQAAADEEVDAHLRSEWALRLLERLGGEERHIICSRFGVAGGEPCTLEEIARDLGTSRERVRVMEQRALERLRLWAEGFDENAAAGEPSAGGLSAAGGQGPGRIGTCSKTTWWSATTSGSPDATTSS